MPWRPVLAFCRKVRRLAGYCARRGQRLTECQPHCGNLLLLIDNDFLCDSTQLLVVPIAQLGLQHVDRTLMMRDHHGGKVVIHVTGWLDVHTGRHLV
jgi:hypothetical protein